MQPCREANKKKRLLAAGLICAPSVTSRKEESWMVFAFVERDRFRPVITEKNPGSQGGVLYP